MSRTLTAHPPQPVRPSSFAELHAAAAATATAVTGLQQQEKAARALLAASWQASCTRSQAERRQSGACRRSQRGACVCRPAVVTWAVCWWRISHVALLAALFLTWNHLLTADRSQPIHQHRRPPSIKMGKSFCTHTSPWLYAPPHSPHLPVLLTSPSLTLEHLPFDFQLSPPWLRHVSSTTSTHFTELTLTPPPL